MARAASRFICQECGAEHRKWVGRCETCGAWNAITEEVAPRSAGRVRLLSPFDNVVIQRQRGREVFGFDYQIECYLPGPQRQYGYFCLPILYRDRLVGRADCKAHRDRGLLEIRSLHLERRIDDGFEAALGRELEAFAAFNHCRDITASSEAANRYLQHLQASPG